MQFTWDAIMIKMPEIFQSNCYQVIRRLHKIALMKPKKIQSSSMLDFNMEVNAGVEKTMVNTGKSTKENATWYALKIQISNVEVDG